MCEFVQGKGNPACAFVQGEGNPACEFVQGEGNPACALVIPPQTLKVHDLSRK